jgi:hypothetical protein
VDGNSDDLTAPPLTPGLNGSLDKGKRREVVGPATPGGDADEDGDGSGKKKRNNYKHLIKGIPGMSLV